MVCNWLSWYLEPGAWNAPGLRTRLPYSLPEAEGNVPPVITEEVLETDDPRLSYSLPAEENVPPVLTEAVLESDDILGGVRRVRVLRPSTYL